MSEDIKEKVKVTEKPPPQAPTRWKIDAPALFTLEIEMDRAPMLEALGAFEAMKDIVKMWYQEKNKVQAMQRQKIIKSGPIQSIRSFLRH